MKKLFLTLLGLFILLMSSPIFAQIEDPGDDPDVPAPIDSYIWVLLAVALVYVFLRFRTSNLKRSIS